MDGRCTRRHSMVRFRTLEGAYPGLTLVAFCKAVSHTERLSVMRFRSTHPVNGEHTGSTLTMV